MSLTSVKFLLFLVLTGIVYYVLPKKMQCYSLLVASIAFYCMAGVPWTFLYLFVSIITVYAGTILMEQIRKKGLNRSQKFCRVIYVAVLLCNFGILAALKYTNFVIYNMQHVIHFLHLNWSVQTVSWAASLGISYYTLQMMSYLTDVYWGVQKPQHNFWQMALFACFFPQMVSGPISRYSQLGIQLEQEHAFSLAQVESGAQRILLGFLQKLVISEKLAVIVNTIFADPGKYHGLYIWTAMLIFPVQIYADFSGCMDIVNGAAECFGIMMPENFRTPFFSKTIQEFWQRWHITLGLWLKDYVMYPILKSETWIRMGQRLKKKYGKKAGKRIPLYSAMLILWFCNGIWHGNSWKYIVGVGLWYWLAIVTGQLLEPLFSKLTSFLHIPVQSVGWHIFQSVRTYVVYGFGALFFCASDLRNGVFLVQCGLSEFNLKIFVDGSFCQMGLDIYDLVVVGIMTVFAFAVSLYGRNGSVREKMRSWNPLVRGGAFVLLFVLVLIFGSYGNGYNASSFIYAKF